MGPNIDAVVEERRDYRPSPAQYADAMYEWDPKTDPAAAPDFPLRMHLRSPRGEFRRMATSV